jgi:hypothetical protein
MSMPANPAVRADFTDASSRLKRVGVALLPFAIILLWSAVVRLPFYEQTDKDEFFFMVIAREWLQGGLPYVATFDIKPPGLFFVFAVAEAIFGASQATIKGIEIVAVGLGAYALYRLLRSHGSERSARWAAALYPVYTLTLGGTVAPNMIVTLPLVIMAFQAAFGVFGVEAERNKRLRSAFVAGLAIGSAGMMRQTAIFEATAIFVCFAIFAERRLLVRATLAYAVGAATPALAFAAYFLAVGHFRDLFQAVIVLAHQRTSDDVTQLYGQSLAFWLTPWGVVLNTILTSAPFIFLWGGVIFLVLRLADIRKVFPARTLAVAVIWVAAAFIEVMASLDLNTYYLMTAVPPLLILAAAFFAHGIRVQEGRPAGRAAIVSAIVAMLVLAYVDRTSLFTPNRFLAGDYVATREVGARIRALSTSPNDRLLVLNRGLAVFAETGLLPPAPYFHPTQLLGAMHMPVADPLAVALGANPRFVVLADPHIWHITEKRARLDEALAYLHAHYRVAAEVDGAKDSFTLYEYAGT